MMPMVALIFGSSGIACPPVLITMIGSVLCVKSTGALNQFGGVLKVVPGACIPACNQANEEKSDEPADSLCV